jgi:hypothetical protein
MRRTPSLTLRLALAAAVLLGGAACNEKNGKGPKVAESTDQPAYAIRYPENLQRTSGNAAGHEEKTRTAMSKWSAFPGQVKDPADWKVIGQIIDAADEDGKSSSYDQEAEQQAQVQSFIDQEREPIVKKIGGSAQYAAKQGGCNVDVYGAVSGGMKDAFEDRYKERIRERGDAYILIERNKEKIGKPNVAAVEETAATVSEASWRVNIAMERERDRLQEQVGQASGVRSTLQEFIEDEKKLQAEAGRTPDEVKASQERVQVAEKSLAALDGAEQQAKDAVAQYEQKQKALKQEHEDALKALKQAIADKAGSQPAAAAPAKK